MGWTGKHMNGESYWHASEGADGLQSRCGGSGVLQCYCGGDLCVCGNFGEAECYGCPDCEEEDHGGDQWAGEYDELWPDDD